MATPRHYEPPPGSPSFAALVLAHGAGAGQAHPFMIAMAERFAARGIAVTTFDFPYMEAKRKAPDPKAKLEACFRAVLERALGAARVPLFVGGKSMGGRIGSQVVAAGGPLASRVAGLVFLGYPLHPPGKPDVRRDAHLPAIEAPMLFVQGERDTFGTPDEIAAILPRLAAGSRLFGVAGGDHSLAVPKRAAPNGEAVLDGVADTVAGWMREVLTNAV